MTEQDSDSPSFDLKGVLITLLVAAIVGYVGLQVFAAEVTQDDLNKFEKSEEYTTTGCMGIVCEGEDITGLLGVMGITGVLAVILTHLTSIRGPREQDDLDNVKQLYVEGEIGILELEERLDDEMDE